MTAFDELRESFTAAMEVAKPYDCYRGADWWQLSEAEEEVFGLRLDHMHALVLAWQWFTAVADIAHNDYHDSPLCLAVRAEADFIEPRCLDLPAWGRFAQLLGIPTALSFRWFWKEHFHAESGRDLPAADGDTNWPWATDDVLAF